MNTPSRKLLVLSVLSASILMACGGGGGSSSTTPVPPPPTPTAPAGPVLDPASYDIRQLVFSWDAVADADYYRLYENADGASGFSPISGNLTGTTFTHDIAVLTQDWPDARYLVEACNTVGCTDSTAITASQSARAIGYFKASNSETNDAFGFDVALSGDGMTLAAGARDEDSVANTIDGDQADNTASAAGAAYVFFNDGTAWAQQAYIKPANTDAGDEFGRRAVLSQDGNTLVVAAHKEDSNATTIGGDDSDDSAADAGAVYVFTRDNAGVWTQQAYLKASNAEAGDNFGYDLALSADGNTLAVGAINEDSNASGVINNDPGNAAELNNGSAGAGAVYVFTRAAGIWTHKAYIKAANTDDGDSFGYAVALSDDGGTLAVGAIWEDTAAGGIDPAADELASNAGAVYVYSLDLGGDWAAESFVKAATVDADDNFGHAVSLSNDGSTLAVGANGEDSNAITIDGDATNNAAATAGAAYVFARNLGVWTQQAYLKAPNTQAGDRLGDTLDLSNDGNTLAVGAANNLGPGGEDSAATGINGNWADNSATDSGAVYLFNRAGVAWTQGVYVKASNTGANDAFGAALSVADDGQSMVVGAHGERSAANGVSGDQTDDSAGIAGAAYLY